MWSGLSSSAGGLKDQLWSADRSSSVHGGSDLLCLHSEIDRSASYSTPLFPVCSVSLALGLQRKTSRIVYVSANKRNFRFCFNYSGTTTLQQFRQSYFPNQWLRCLESEQIGIRRLCGGIMLLFDTKAMMLMFVYMHMCQNVRSDYNYHSLNLKLFNGTFCIGVQNPRQALEAATAAFFPGRRVFTLSVSNIIKLVGLLESSVSVIKKSKQETEQRIIITLNPYGFDLLCQLCKQYGTLLQCEHHCSKNQVYHVIYLN